MLTHRQIARRKATRWQVGAVALIACAGAAVALPLHERLTPPKPVYEQPPVPTPETTRGAGLSALNFQQTAMTLKLLGPAGAAAATPTTDSTPEQAATPTTGPAPTAANEWVYVGYLSTPTTRTAMVRVDGEQLLFSVGAKHHDSTVKTIEPSYVEIERQGATKRLELAQRTMAFPTEGPKRPVQTRGPQAGGQAPMAMTQPQLNQPAMPNQFDQARMAALEQARRAQMGEKAQPMPDRSMFEPAAVYKRMTDPNAGLEQRIAALREYGITSGMPVDEAIVRIKMLAGDRTDDILKVNEEALQENANGKREGGG